MQEVVCSLVSVIWIDDIGQRVNDLDAILPTIQKSGINTIFRRFILRDEVCEQVFRDTQAFHDDWSE
jgi:hypothetical protein